MEKGVVYNELNGGEILYKDTSDHLVYFVSGSTAPVEEIIYWGKYATKTITESIILNNLTQAVGPVGLPSGRTYTFPDSTSKFLYWCIPLYPTGSTSGVRVIEQVRIVTPDGYLSLQDATPYTNVQANPSPLQIQTIKYAIINVNGVPYRVYRSKNTYGISPNNTNKVYSIIE